MSSITVLRIELRRPSEDCLDAADGSVELAIFDVFGVDPSLLIISGEIVSRKNVNRPAVESKKTSSRSEV